MCPPGTTATWTSAGSSGATPHSPARSRTSTWRPNATCTRFAFRPIRCCSVRSSRCRRGQWAGRRTGRWSGIMTSSTRRAVGTSLVGWWRRSSITRVPTYIGTTGKAHQDLPAGRQVGAKVVTHARYVIFQMAEVAVPKKLFRAILERTCLPQAGTTVVAARDGAGMMARTVETAGEGGGDGDDLRGSAMNPSTQAALGEIMARQRPDTPSTEQKECLPISRSVVESPERSKTRLGGPTVPARRDRPKAIREIPDREPEGLPLCRGFAAVPGRSLVVGERPDGDGG